jgi:hypothetical protein
LTREASGSGRTAALGLHDALRASAMTDNKTRHDFKNQLAIIHGFAELLLADAAADDPHRHDLEEICKAVVTALDLLARMELEHADARMT